MISDDANSSDLKLSERYARWLARVKRTVAKANEHVDVDQDPHFLATLEGLAGADDAEYQRWLEEFEAKYGLIPSSTRSHKAQTIPILREVSPGNALNKERLLKFGVPRAVVNYLRARERFNEDSPEGCGEELKAIRDMFSPDLTSALSEICHFADSAANVREAFVRGHYDLEHWKSREYKHLRSVEAIADKYRLRQSMLDESEGGLWQVKCNQFVAEVAQTEQELRVVMDEVEEARRKLLEAEGKRDRIVGRIQTMRAVSSAAAANKSLVALLTKMHLELAQVSATAVERRIKVLDDFDRYQETLRNKFASDEFERDLPVIFSKIMGGFMRSQLNPDKNDSSMQLDGLDELFGSSSDAESTLQAIRAGLEIIRLWRQLSAKFATESLIAKFEEFERILMAELRTVEASNPGYLSRCTDGQYDNSTVFMYFNHIFHDTPAGHFESRLRMDSVVAVVHGKINADKKAAKKARLDGSDEYGNDALVQDSSGVKKLVALPCVDILSPPEWVLPLVHAPAYLRRLQRLAEEARRDDLLIPLEFDSDEYDMSDDDSINECAPGRSPRGGDAMEVDGESDGPLNPIDLKPETFLHAATALSPADANLASMMKAPSAAGSSGISMVSAVKERVKGGAPFATLAGQRKRRRRFEVSHSPVAAGSSKRRRGVDQEDDDASSVSVAAAAAAPEVQGSPRTTAQPQNAFRSAFGSPSPAGLSGAAGLFSVGDEVRTPMGIGIVVERPSGGGGGGGNAYGTMCVRFNWGAFGYFIPARLRKDQKLKTRLREWKMLSIETLSARARSMKLDVCSDEFIADVTILSAMMHLVKSLGMDNASFLSMCNDKYSANMSIVHFNDWRKGFIKRPHRFRFVMALIQVLDDWKLSLSVGDQQNFESSARLYKQLYTEYENDLAMIQMAMRKGPSQGRDSLVKLNSPKVPAPSPRGRGRPPRAVPSADASAYGRPHLSSASSSLVVPKRRPGRPRLNKSPSPLPGQNASVAEAAAPREMDLSEDATEDEKEEAKAAAGGASDDAQMSVSDGSSEFNDEAAAAAEEEEEEEEGEQNVPLQAEPVAKSGMPSALVFEKVDKTADSAVNTQLFQVTGNSDMSRQMDPGVPVKSELLQASDVLKADTFRLDSHASSCEACKKQGKLLMCESCPYTYHLRCCIPKLTAIPENDWFCHRCLECGADSLNVIDESEKTAALCNSWILIFVKSWRRWTPAYVVDYNSKFNAFLCEYWKEVRNRKMKISQWLNISGCRILRSSRSDLDDLRDDGMDFSVPAIHAAPKPVKVSASGDQVDQLAAMADTFIGGDSYNSALCGAAVACRAVDTVMENKNTNVFACIRPPGHHAGRHGYTRGCMSTGFCLLNNAAIALTYARIRWGIRRVAVVDIDVHFGNGTAELLRGDPNAFFACTHMIHGAENSGFKQTSSRLRNEKGKFSLGFYPNRMGLTEISDNFLSIGLFPQKFQTSASNKPVAETLSCEPSETEQPHPDLCGPGGFRYALEYIVLPRLIKFDPELLIISGIYTF
jgi:acetoin utilization deacetylase AcuC-like enzyme